MNLKNFASLFEESVRDLIRKPFIILPGLAFFLVILGFSKIGGAVGYSLQTTSSNLIWVVFSAIFFLVVGGFFSAGLIGMCEKIIKREKIGGSFFFSAKKFWLRNSFVLVLFLAFFELINLVLFVFTKLMLLISSKLVVSASAFRVLSIMIVFVLLAGFIIFFTFSNFFIVVNKMRIGSGIRSSIRLVKRKYLATLSISVIFFVLIYFINKIEGIIGDLISYGIILPFIFLVLTRFILEFD